MLTYSVLAILTECPSIMFNKRLECTSMNWSNLWISKAYSPTKLMNCTKMVENKLFSKSRMFWSKLCKSNWINASNLAFPVFISPIVRKMCENLHYELVYFKGLHNDQEYYMYWLTKYRAGAAVVLTITSYILVTLACFLSCFLCWIHTRDHSFPQEKEE